MVVVITNRSKKNIRGIYWRSTGGSLNRTQETKSFEDNFPNIGVNFFGRDIAYAYTNFSSCHAIREVWAINSNE